MTTILPRPASRAETLDEFVTRLGGVVTEFAFEADGLTTWSIDDG